MQLPKTWGRWPVVQGRQEPGPRSSQRAAAQTSPGGCPPHRTGRVCACACECTGLALGGEQTQARLPNSGYNPACSGLFFLPFPNRIWACSLKGEAVLSEWPGPSASRQETSPTSEQQRLPSPAACHWLSLLIQTARLPPRDV